jgi:glycopeptide antibiotics resistance protein
VREVFGVTVQAGPVLVPLLVGAVVVWLLALGHRRELTGPRALTVLVAATYVAGVVAVTFFPMTLVVGPGAARPPWWTQVNVVPGAHVDAANVLLNVVMTVPLGALLPLVLRVRSVTGAALVGVLVSGAVEGAQWAGSVLVGMDRTADVNDLVANATGTVLGFACFVVVDRVAGRALEAFGLPGSAVARAARAAGTWSAQAGPGWFVDEPDEPEEPGGAVSVSRPSDGARTATTAAASRAVPKMRSPNSAYGSR